MSTNPHQIRAGLEPYLPALTRREAAHLLRRTGFGADPEIVNTSVGKTASELVDAMMLFATDTNLNPLPPKPSWADNPQPDRRTATSDEVRTYNANNLLWLEELGRELILGFRNTGLRERLTLFWHNHFVTEIEVYELATYAYRYLTTIRTNCLGNFKTFVNEMGLTPAMLVYLNGDTNDKDSPNENYARELLELFTMSPEDKYGNSNYSQQDVEEVARALTGWIVNKENITTEFNNREFDTGSKTFLGRTGEFDYFDVTDVIFQERSAQIAHFICTKIYREFVFDDPDPDVIVEMSNLFRESNFEIAPVISTLFKSAHFFDRQNIGAKIKSPADLIVGGLLETQLTPNEGLLNLLLEEFELLEQVLMDPPDVSGWKGHRTWLSTDTLPRRWSLSDELLFSMQNDGPIDLIGVAQLLHNDQDPHAAFNLPLSIASHFIPVPLEELDIGAIDDPFSGDLVTFPIPREVVDGPQYAITLAKLFLGDVPWYEWSLEEDGANSVLISFVQYLMQLPEFQLT